MPTRVCRHRFFVIATRICLAAAITYVLGANTNSRAMASSSSSQYNYNEYAGEYNLKEIWDDKGILLPLPRDGPFVLKLSPVDHANSNEHFLGLNIKVDNMMRSSVEFLDDNNNGNDNNNAIRMGPIMSTRMMARTKERQDLESYLGRYLERMTTIDLKPTGATADVEVLLIFTASGTAGNAAASNNNKETEVEATTSMAKIVCQVVEETQQR
uniref:Uncharacterized protein n=1 Tax=Pseudo-nitzschia australis TaxID=44445 RepID=A0A7S4AGJ5_9STRA|mmetsp:Transcript_26414/g.57885  ORF Transcript_26414/g.57885 Transcript_26414/m.57885 type:complete len:213 (+) Transcript_26414:344-982(+)